MEPTSCSEVGSTIEKQVAEIWQGGTCKGFSESHRQAGGTSFCSERRERGESQQELYYALCEIKGCRVAKTLYKDYLSSSVYLVSFLSSNLVRDRRALLGQINFR